MSRSIRDLRELICLSRFGFRSNENDLEITNSNELNNTILFYFDPSILNNWLELTSSRLDKLRSLTTNKFVSFISFWLKQFDYEHKQSLFQMEFELFIEHLILAFTPNDTDSIQISQFGRQVLHDIDKQIGEDSIKNNYEFIYHIDIFNRYQRDDKYRNLLANLPNELTINITNRLHLQWMLAIRAFGLIAICTAAIEFFEKIQNTLEQNRPIDPSNYLRVLIVQEEIEAQIGYQKSDLAVCRLVDFNTEQEYRESCIHALPKSSYLGELSSFQIDDQSLSNNPSDQFKNRILFALRKDYIDVIDYFIKTDQLTGDSLDEQNRNILFHALPIGNISMIEHLLKSNLPNLDINSIAQSGNSLLHVCVTIQRLDLIKLFLQYYPNLNLNQRNKQDATPLHLAIIYNELAIIHFLLQSRADPTLTMKNQTCLQISIEFEHENLIEFFSKLV